QVTRQLNEQGMLYSTEDSVAAIALLSELRKSGLVTGEARLCVNGEEMTAIEAAQLKVPIESIDVLSGVAAVEVTRLHEEDWTRFADNFPIGIRFVNADNSEIQYVRAGDCIELVISLPKGYQTGDIVHVALPPCLSWIRGGVKLFSLDFEGEEVLRIPLLVTSQIEGQEHFAICVRNMFQEERASSRSLLIK
ncbi:general secretion pathway protein E, partial [Candidatus Thiomargarita nelsonii]